MPRLAGSFYKRHAVTVVRTAPAAWGRTVSGAVSLPSRGAFHLSLAVLVRYRSSESVQPWRVVPPASDRVSRARAYSGSGTAVRGVRVRGSHPLRPAFPCRSAPPKFCNCSRGLGAPGFPSRNTCEATAPALAPSQVWARALSLAATRAISVDFSSSGYLDVSVPPVVPRGDGLPAGSRPWRLLGSPIRESRDLRPFAPPPGLSRLAAPFVDFRCQGIRRAPMIPWAAAGPPRGAEGLEHDGTCHLYQWN